MHLHISTQTAHVPAPPSKSLSHRYLIAAALAEGTSHIHNSLECRDLEVTRTLLCHAGAIMAPLPHTAPMATGWRVTGMHGKPLGGTAQNPRDCNVEESGTSCRLLSAVLAAGRGFFRIHGMGRMHQRPLGSLVPALQKLGACFHFEEQPHYPPLVLEARGLRADLCKGQVEVDMDISSQYFSGLLLAAPLASQRLCLNLVGRKSVSWPYVGLTLQCLEDFGIAFVVEARPQEHAPWQAAQKWRAIPQAIPHCLRITVEPGAYRSGRHSIEGDWSGASYFLAAGALGKNPICVEGLRASSLQGDRTILDILQQMGARTEIHPHAITVAPSPLHGLTLDMGHCPDLVPTVAMLAACAQGDTRIGNVAHLRHKESDRIAAIASELQKIGVTVSQMPDGLIIRGSGHAARLLRPDNLSAHNDHRMAMSLALLDLCQQERHVQKNLDDPAVVQKSFPHFWELWNTLPC